MEEFYNIQPAEISNRVDSDGNPSGGYFHSKGVVISWQNGPRLQEDGTLADPNGAFIEDAMYAALQRLEFFQDSKFKCRENALAITHLQEALHWLKARQVARSSRNVEGTHTV